MPRFVVRLTLAAAITFSVACGDDGVSPEPAQSRLKILTAAATAAFWPGDTISLEPRRLDAAGAPL